MKLEDYSIGKNVITTNDLETAEYSHLLDNNTYELIQSILNAHSVSYCVNDLLFKCDQPDGVKALKIFYKVTPKNETKVILYTNVCHPLENLRIIQGIWSFPDKKTFKLFKNEIEELKTWTENTHMLCLPKKINPHKIDTDFVDPYFEKDRADFVNDYLNRHQTEYIAYEKAKLKHLLSVKLISKTEMAKIALMPNKSSLFEEMGDYNNDALDFIDECEAANLSYKDYKKAKPYIRKARSLNERFHELHDYFAPKNMSFYN